MTRLEMAKAIFEKEARRDKNGNLKVYPLPKSDGGGTFEVAGINNRYHPVVAKLLKDLVVNDKQEDAERAAISYIAGYTEVVNNWFTDIPWLEYFLRDRVFNRGAGGAAKTLQIALGVTVDGKVGPKTKSALKRHLKQPYALLGRLRMAVDFYEAETVGYREKFWDGLVNRWDAITQEAGEMI